MAKEDNIGKVGDIEAMVLLIKVKGNIHQVILEKEHENAIIKLLSLEGAIQVIEEPIVNVKLEGDNG